MAVIMGNVGELSEGFGEKLREIRVSKDMSLKDIEEICGVSASYIWRIEIGEKKSPSIPILAKISKAYNISLMDMLKMALEDEIEDNELHTIRGVLMSNHIENNGVELSDEAKNILVDIVEMILIKEWERDTQFKLLKKIDKLKEKL